MTPVIEAIDVTKSFEQGGALIEVLRGTELRVKPGETLAIVGQSGSGKSTLLSLLAGLDRPTQGRVQIAGQDIARLSEDALTAFRARHLSIVFQQFHLMSFLSAQENVSLPLELAKSPNAREIARQALERVGLSHRLTHLPAQLSGGEKQRVAIARAMVTQPKILLADEPSGNLDSETGDQVMATLFEQVRGSGMAMILVTHNEELARRCDRVLKLTHGKLVESGDAGA
jgi:putative ABC transport system ATP-binding protein